MQSKAISREGKLPCVIIGGALSSSFTKTSDTVQNKCTGVFVMKSVLGALLVACTILGTPLAGKATAADYEADNAVIVTVDRAKVFRLSKAAGTVIVGNPAVVDATIEDAETIVLTGRSFGVTNLIVLDAAGDPIVDETVVVRGHESNTVRIYRQSSRETMACAPICEPTLTIGDDQAAFEFANRQIQQRNQLSDSNAQ